MLAASDEEAKASCMEMYSEGKGKKVYISEQKESKLMVCKEDE